MSNGTPVVPKPGTRKIAVGAIAGAAATIAVWFLNDVIKVDVPADISGALGTLFTTLFVYLTPETYT